MNDYINGRGASVALNAFERRMVKHIVNMRIEANRKAGIVDSKRSDEDGLKQDINAYGAEIAFCKVMNLYPDFSCNPRSEKTSQQFEHDAYLWGFAVDVKQTKHMGGKLICVPWKAHPADYYGLMVGEFPRYTFKGIREGRELHKLERLMDLGKGLHYGMDQKELYDPALILPGFSHGAEN